MDLSLLVLSCHLLMVYRSKDNIKLQVSDNTLTISGERNEETREEGDKETTSSL